ncbi:MAG: bifunctional oligoribonuclease/PAP phosphatase NrnA [Bacteroidales bacterium]
MIYDDYTSIISLLTTEKKILITAHANPDGDAIGSALALFHFLSGRGYLVKVIVPNDFPSFLAWMPGIDNLIVFKHREKEVIELAIDADIILCLDYNGLKRVEKMQIIFGKSKADRILIDHHPQPEVSSFKYLISKTKTSSTSELVYDFIVRTAGIGGLSKIIADCLYVGIATDTGSFSYSCNYPETFMVVAELVRQGIDTEKIHRLVYDTYSESRMRLLGYSLSEKMKVLADFGTAYIALSKEDLKRFNFQIGDTEGLVNYALSIDGISMAVLFTEKDSFIRMSLRSKGKFSVNEFVNNHFEGGGHKNAAGGNSYLSLEETLAKFEALLPEYQEDLLNCFCK